MSVRWRVPAPAKLTVSLTVTGVRADGYHELAAEMVSLDLADELLIDPAGAGITVRPDGGGRTDGLPVGPDNLVARALVAVGRAAGVELVKRIPVGGGLGGGSSDAGAILRWAGCSDLEVAAAIGSDVPFCVAGGRAMVTGGGEQVAPLGFEPRSVVLLIPPFGVETARVYRRWDELSEAGAGPWHEPPNDLTRPAIEVEPRLAPWRAAFEQATGRSAILAGSGSTWFVDGTLERFDGDPDGGIRVGRERGRVVQAHTVPAAWGRPVELGETAGTGAPAGG
ncbi:MAG TPA: 4-(cytidine 5'-diphospho)-2-C-methyl-D-erythritol kinase [Acidimicrobiales bacterium]